MCRMRTTSASPLTPERSDALQVAAAGAPPTRVQLTAHEYERCVEELRALRAERTSGLVRLLRSAREFVAADATEEIAQLQAGQAAADMHISRLERLLGGCEIVHHLADEQMVHIGCTVELEFSRSGARKRFELVGVGLGAAGPSATHRITARSPVGQAILGRAVGDVVTAQLPGDLFEEVVILSVTPPSP